VPPNLKRKENIDHNLSACCCLQCRIGVMDGGPDSTDIHRVTEHSSAAHNWASNSPGTHSINIDHGATDKL
jgi:hypothetical protein